MWKRAGTILVVVLAIVVLNDGTSPIHLLPTSAQGPQQTPGCAVGGTSCLAAMRASALRESKKKDTKLFGGLDALAAQAQIMNVEAASANQLPKPLRDLTKAHLMRLDSEGRVQVYVESKQPGQLVHVLEALGAKIERVNEDYGIAQAWLPAANLQSVAQLGAVSHIRLPDYGVTQAGSRMTEGDALLNADDLRSTFGVDGTGIRVGVISDGVEGLAASQASGDLPSVNTTTCDVGPGSPTGAGAGAEGTAMLEIVHDMAPGAELWFGYWDPNGSGTVQLFTDAENCLADNVDVIVDDYGFFNIGPYDGTSQVSTNTAGTLSDPSNRVRAYYTAVGNAADKHYQGSFIDAGAGNHLFQGGSTTIDQYPFGPRSDNPTIVPGGAVAAVFLQWNDPFGGSCNDYDMMAWYHNTATLIAQSVGPQTCSQNPTELVVLDNTAGPDTIVDITIGKFSGSARTLSLFFVSSYPNFLTPCSSVPNNGDSGGGVISVGAIDASDPGTNEIEPFSSCGPTNDGRLKPEAVAIDDVTVTGSGGFGSPFGGTSAAAPHAAAIAALLLDCNPNLTRSQLHDALLNSAVDLGPAGLDQHFGHGRLDAVAAANAAGCSAPVAPTGTATRTRTPAPTPTRTPTPTPPPGFVLVSLDSAALPTGASGSLALTDSSLGPPGLGAWTVDIVQSGTSAAVESCTPSDNGVCNTSFAPNTTRFVGSSGSGLLGAPTLGTLHVQCLRPGSTVFEVHVDIMADATIGDPQPLATVTHDGKVTCASGQGQGDTDCNGLLTPTDALLILQLVAAIIDNLPCADQADVDGNVYINPSDALLILQYVAGLIDGFP